MKDENAQGAIWDGFMVEEKPHSGQAHIRGLGWFGKFHSILAYPLHNYWNG